MSDDNAVKIIYIKHDKYLAQNSHKHLNLIKNVKCNFFTGDNN